MPDYLHVASGAIRLSAKPASCPAPDWSPFATRADAITLSSVPSYFRTADESGPREMTTEEKDTNALVTVKQLKIQAIDTKTAQIIGQGFQHATVTFSLSLSAQVNWSWLRDHPDTLTYPYGVSNLDDTQVYEFENAAEIQTAADAGAAAVENAVTSGRVLKAQVLAASTVAGVDAVVDAR